MDRDVAFVNVAELDVSLPVPPTVRRNVSVAARDPSLTRRVIVAVPLWPAAGLMVTVRDEPLPPRVIAEVGTRVVFDEDAVTTRFCAAVSLSLTVNPRAPVVPPTATVVAGTSLMNGAVLVDVPEDAVM